MPVIQEQLMQIDLHRTYFSAVAAKRRGETEVLPLIKILHVWRYHTTDRSTVRGSVSMSADVFVDRTGIQASTAADAVKAFTLLGVGENIRSSVVKQNDIHLFRTIRLVWLARTAYDRIVYGHLLTCPESRQQGPEKCEVIQGRNDFFDACHDDMDFRPCATKPAVTFILRDGDAARFRYDEIRSGDAHFGRDVFAAQIVSGDHGEFLGRHPGSGAKLIRKKSGHILLALMHGGCHDVVWWLVIQLLDVFPEVRLDTFNTVLFKEFVQMYFFRGHALALHHGLAVMPAADLSDGFECIVRGIGPDDTPASFHEISFELLELRIKGFDGFPLYRLRFLTRSFQVGELLLTLRHNRIVFSYIKIDLTAMLKILRFDRTLCYENFSSLSHEIRCLVMNIKNRSIVMQSIPVTFCLFHKTPPLPSPALHKTPLHTYG